VRAATRAAWKVVEQSGCLLQVIGIDRGKSLQVLVAAPCAVWCRSPYLGNHRVEFRQVLLTQWLYDFGRQISSSPVLFLANYAFKRKRTVCSSFVDAELFTT
jgi:hypothetical protein